MSEFYLRVNAPFSLGKRSRAKGSCFDTSQARETAKFYEARASCFAFPRNLSEDLIRSGDARAMAFVIEIVVMSKLKARA